MRDDFLSLRAWLRGTDAENEPGPTVDAVSEIPEEVPESIADVADSAREHERGAALAEIRRFRAALADALESCVADALREVVIAVLGRELTVAPVEIGAIVRRVLATCANDDVLAVHVHPDECNAIDDAGVTIVADSSLRRGDVTVSLRCGSIDAKLGARVADVLETFGGA
jgi:flagellar biosynthesis/type III secretory pathway protein FliH